MLNETIKFTAKCRKLYLCLIFIWLLSFLSSTTLSNMHDWSLDTPSVYSRTAGRHGAPCHRLWLAWSRWTLSTAPIPRPRTLHLCTYAYHELLICFLMRRVHASPADTHSNRHASAQLGVPSANLPPSDCDERIDSLGLPWLFNQCICIGSIQCLLIFRIIYSTLSWRCE